MENVFSNLPKIELLFDHLIIEIFNNWLLSVQLNVWILFKCLQQAKSWYGMDIYISRMNEWVERESKMWCCALYILQAIHVGR